MPTHYNKLTLKDKLAFLHLFKDDASGGPANAAFCLIELDIIVSESELTLIFKDLGWSPAYIAKLALLAPNHLTV